MPATLIERGIEACEACARACESALGADDSYTSPGTGPYSRAQLALVSCASVCSLLARALREGDGDLELVRWCADMCAQCAGAELAAGDAAAARAVQACALCERECRLLFERITGFARHAMNVRSDTDFQALQDR